MSTTTVEVWMARTRRDSQYHQQTGARPTPTGCGRSTRTGDTLTVEEARDLGAKPCPRCWPPDEGRSRP